MLDLIDAIVRDELRCDHCAEHDIRHDGTGPHIVCELTGEDRNEDFFCCDYNEGE
jgi:hypothetical protein